MEKKLGNEWEFMRDWGGKLVGAAVRIAALFHAAETQDPAGELVSLEVMLGAIKIAEFLGPHAEAAYQVMGANESQSDAKYILPHPKLGEIEAMERTKEEAMREQINRVVQMIRDYEALRNVAQYASRVWIDTEHDRELLIREEEQ